MSARADLAAQITEEWAEIPALAGVRVVASERELDDVQDTTLQIQFRTVDNSTAQGLRDYGFLLTLISPHLDLDLAADELDALIPEVRDWLKGIRAGTTTIVGFAGRLAAETPITVFAQKEEA